MAEMMAATSDRDWSLDGFLGSVSGRVRLRPIEVPKAVPGNKSDVSVRLKCLLVIERQ